MVRAIQPRATSTKPPARTGKGTNLRMKGIAQYKTIKAKNIQNIW